MLVNPFKDTLSVIPGSRILLGDLGLIGRSFQDQHNPQRTWSITNIYAPVKSRAIGGIRAKLEDQKGFVSFCNQRDLELLLCLAKPGNLCSWLNEEYPELDSPQFFGLCTDYEDLTDDLFERELLLREMMREEGVGPVIPNGYQMTRRLHLDISRDVEELDMMLFDCDPESGLGPDPRFETLVKRWSCVERNTLRWEAA